MLRSLLMIATVAGIYSASNNQVAKTHEQTGTVTAATRSALSQEEVNDGWVSLFDGKTTKGWHKYGGKPAGKSWKAEEGILHLEASQKDPQQIRDGGDIVTDEEYENFDLKLEWKIDTCGNSGIIFYSHEDTSLYRYMWATGPEMQVLDNRCNPDARINKHRAGDLYDLIASSPEVVKPALQWNAVEIKSLNGNLEFYLNGVKVVSTTMWDDNWRNMIAHSKFREMKGFGTFKKGRIGLQDHGHAVWFRNIKIKRL